ncbi:MAG: ester cyclase [Pseudomonadota bacterium]
MTTFLQRIVTDGDLSLIDDIAQPDMVDEANQLFGGPPGRAGLVAHVRGFRKHLDQRKLRVHRIVASEDHVMAWWSFSAVHTGLWLGKPPTDQPVAATVFSFFALHEGLIQRYALFVSARFTDEIRVLDTALPDGGLFSQ